MPDEIQESEKNNIAVDSYFKGDTDAGTLTEEQLEMAMERKYSNNEEAPQVPVVEKPTEPVVQGKTQAELATEVDPQHEAIRKLQVELNQANQREKTATDRYTRIKTDETYRDKELGVKKTYTVDKNQDMLDDDYLKEIGISKQKIDTLEAKIDAWETKELEASDAKAANKANDDLFGDINRMQEEFPSLKTSIPFRDFNDEYNSWNNRMSQAGKDINRYMEDETYRATVDSEGLAPNLQLNDIKSGLTIYSGVNKMNEEIKAGYKSDFSHAFKDTTAYKSVYDAKYRGAELANEQALNSRVDEINSQAQIMRPSEVSQGRDTEQSLMAELQNPNLTDERLAEIDKFLQAQNQ